MQFTLFYSSNNNNQLIQNKTTIDNNDNKDIFNYVTGKGHYTKTTLIMENKHWNEMSKSIGLNLSRHIIDRKCIVLHLVT